METMPQRITTDLYGSYQAISILGFWGQQWKSLYTALELLLSFKKSLIAYTERVTFLFHAKKQTNGLMTLSARILIIWKKQNVKISGKYLWRRNWVPAEWVPEILPRKRAQAVWNRWWAAHTVLLEEPHRKTPTVMQETANTAHGLLLDKATAFTLLPQSACEIRGFMQSSTAALPEKR